MQMIANGSRVAKVVPSKNSAHTAITNAINLEDPVSANALRAERESECAPPHQRGVRKGMDDSYMRLLHVRDEHR